MKRAVIIAAALAAASTAAQANNNEKVAQCMLHGVVTGKTGLAEDALKLADNPRAADIIAQSQMRDMMMKTTDKDTLAAAWVGGCDAIGLKASSYAVTPPKPKPKREPTADELRNR